MTFEITTVVIALVVFVAFVFIARRVFRLALKLALVGALVVLLLGGVGVGWWRGWFGSASPSDPKPQRATPQSNQRPNSNRRPSPR